MTNPDLQLAPIHFPVVGNSVIVGIVSLLHIALASLSVGFMLLAPIFEAMGRTNPLYTALARGITRFTLIVFSASAVLAVIMVELFIGLFPVTTMWIWNQFRHLLYLGVAAFFLQLFALYPYYHYWEAIRRHSVRLHLLMGIMAAALILIWVIVLDGMGSYMLTPTDRPGRWPDPLNPTWLPLALHRLIGDFVIAGYGLAGYAAWRLGRWERRSPETPNGTDPSAAYFGHVLKTGFAVGLTTFNVRRRTPMPTSCTAAIRSCCTCNSPCSACCLSAVMCGSKRPKACRVSHGGISRLCSAFS